jgi:phage shock protein A
MQFFEWVILRLVLFVGIPTIVAVVVLGPSRVERILSRWWNWFWGKRYEPEQLLAEVVRKHQDQVAAHKRTVEIAEAAERDAERNHRKSEAEIASLEKKARQAVRSGDDLGARAILLKLNLERRQAAKSQEEWDRRRLETVEERKKLYLLELELRQFEVGRESFLQQVATAATMDQQLAVARNFDPFNTIAAWRRSEETDDKLVVPSSGCSAPPPLQGGITNAASSEIDLQIAELKAQLESAPSDANEADEADPLSDHRPQRSAPIKGGEQ